MYDDLTPGEYEGWCQAYEQDPWGEARDDQRNSATVLWLRWQPKHEGDEPDLPNLHFPYWETKQQKVENEVEMFKRLKQQGLEAQQRLKEKRLKERGN